MRQQRSVVQLDRLPDVTTVEQTLYSRDVGLDVARQPVRIGVQRSAEQLAQSMDLDTGGARGPGVAVEIGGQLLAGQAPARSLCVLLIPSL